MFPAELVLGFREERELQGLLTELLAELSKSGMLGTGSSGTPGIGLVITLIAMRFPPVPGLPGSPLQWIGQRLLQTASSGSESDLVTFTATEFSWTW